MEVITTHWTSEDISADLSTVKRVLDEAHPPIINVMVEI